MLHEDEKQERRKRLNDKDDVEQPRWSISWEGEAQETHQPGIPKV